MKLYLVYGRSSYTICDVGFSRISVDSLYGIYSNKNEATKLKEKLEKDSILRSLEEYYIVKESLNSPSSTFKNSVLFKEDTK